MPLVELTPQVVTVATVILLSAVFIGALVDDLTTWRNKRDQKKYDERVRKDVTKD